MPETPTSLTPTSSFSLTHHAPAQEGRMLSVRIDEVVDRAMIDVRIRAAEGDEVLAALGSVLGVSLPPEVRRAVGGSGGCRVLWLSPDQWLVTLPLARGAAMVESLRGALGDHHGMVTDVSDARAVFRLEGEGVREVLMKGMAADLLAGGFGAGDVRRGLMAEMGSLVDCIGESPDVFEVYVFRSYGAHMWDWLARAADPESVVRLFRRG